MKYSAPKGTRDILPDEIAVWQSIEELFRQVCALYLYGEIRTPVFENTEVFTRGVGNTTDIVQKEMYTFDDKGGRSITLRPEGTAGVARAYIENGLDSVPSPVRLFYMIHAFRYENVQKGRYREFHQLGAEAFGSPGPEIDAEIISMLNLFFKRLGVDHLRVKINTIGCPLCRVQYNEILRKYLLSAEKPLCSLCLERTLRNPLRVLDCKNAQCQLITAKAPVLADHLCDECKEHFKGLQRNLITLDIPYDVDTSIVRGLDYYTKTVFEFISENVGTQGTICGGGRYDGLIEELGGKPTPGIGFALGVERLMLEMQARGIVLQVPPKASLYLVYADETGQDSARRICYELRQAGIVADVDLLGRSFRSQMKLAGKGDYSYFTVIGENEIKQGSIVFKNTTDKTQIAVSLQSLGRICYDKKGEIIWPNQ